MIYHYLQVHLLIDCPKMNQYRDTCCLGSFIRVHRRVRPGISSIKLFALFLDDKDPKAIKKKAIDLYTMIVGWHSQMKIDI